MKMSKFLFFLISFVLGTTYLYSQSVDVTNVDTFPEYPLPPDLLLVGNGQSGEPIETAAQWEEKRQWIGKNYQYWVSGSIPPPPDKFESEIISERIENGVTLRMVKIRFGPGLGAEITIELMIPSGSGPFPVFMTQWNHRGWAQIAVRRGYIGCVYAGADAKDDTGNYSDIYPDYDFATLMKRAWGGSRAIDYLYTMEEVDTNKIGLTGHSRNGKQSLMAAAFDTRIDAVISSSGGAGGESIFRYMDERFDTNSLEEITRKNPQWFHERLRAFSGKEDKLPVDQHSLMALIAPRGLMLSSAITESQGNPWGVEQAYKEVKKVYDFMDSSDHLAVNLRGGRHATASRDIEDFVDFFDYIFDRSDIQPKNEIFYDYSFEKWSKLAHGSKVEAELKSINPTVLQSDFSNYKDYKEDVRHRIKKLLGREPGHVLSNSVLSWKKRKTEDDYLGDVIGQPVYPGMRKMLIRPYDAMGDYLWANVYLPSNAIITEEKIEGSYPVVIYLHEHSNSTGYRRRIQDQLQRLTENGYAVIAFDMIGFGTRIEEYKSFYHRYPHWSIMGSMVADTRNVIHDAIGKLDFVDSENVYLFGYSLGGTVALLTAALDDKVKGVAVANGFSSLRQVDKGVEGVLYYSHLHGLIPSLGCFLGEEDKIPIDFDEILSCIAPKSLLIMAGTEDRHHPIEQVREMTEAAKGSFDHFNAKITLYEEDHYDQLTDPMKHQFLKWLNEVRE
ncbi:hypothetical protein GCM10025777_02330 [Membranihabitans marinus]